MNLWKSQEWSLPSHNDCPKNNKRWLLCCENNTFQRLPNTTGVYIIQLSLRPAIHLSRNMQKWVRNAKNEKCIARHFASLFSLFAALFSLFAFHIFSCQGWHSRKKSKDFAIYFFATLIKHKIRMKGEKCILSVSYFMVCFAKTLAKCKMRKVYSRPNVALYATKLCNVTPPYAHQRCSTWKYQKCLRFASKMQSFLSNTIHIVITSCILQRGALSLKNAIDSNAANTLTLILTWYHWNSL